MRVWIYLKSWERYEKIVIIPPVLNKKKIREINLYRIREILGTENPRVFVWVYLTLLAAVVERGAQVSCGASLHSDQVKQGTSLQTLITHAGKLIR
jgi:hypothetical protein